MSQFIVFDIETYRPNWQVRQTRRQDLDPARNSIITTGIFNGKELSIHPIIEDLRNEREPLEFFLNKLEKNNSTLIGYNCLHFDVPYLAYKARIFGKNLDFTKLKLLDLYWILPYWLHTLPNGIKFHKKFYYLGNLWSFDKVVTNILKERPNPFSNFEVLKLWEEKRFNDIKKHLELDLLNTFSFLKSSVIQEALKHIETQQINKDNCKDSCPYHKFLPKTSDKAICYCAIKQEITSGERKLSAVDIIAYPLPKRGISWKPYCI